MDARASSEEEHVSEERPVIRQRGSHVYLDEWVVPNVTDDRGFLRAGKLLEWMDVVGVVAATRHCRHPVVRESIDGMVLRAPIRVGGLVTISASVTHTSERGIGVSVSVTRADPWVARRRSVLKAYMSFVALEASGSTAFRERLATGEPRQASAAEH
jgi:acyl-CoA hydrolase